MLSETLPITFSIENDTSQRNTKSMGGIKGTLIFNSKSNGNPGFRNTLIVSGKTNDPEELLLIT